MKNIIFSLLLLTTFIGCQNKIENSDVITSSNDSAITNFQETISSKEDTYHATSDSLFPLIYEFYEKEGYVLKGKLRLFDNSRNFLKTIQFETIVKIQILEKSNRLQYIDGKVTDNCERAYFLKIQIKDSIYTVFGQDVYERVDKQTFKIKNKLNEILEVFSIKPLKIGCSDEYGLSGCDEFYYLAINNKTTNSISTISFPENGKSFIEREINYAVLFNDDMIGEDIYKVKFKEDTIVLDIKVMGQEHSGKFKYKLFQQENKWKSLITDTVYYNGEDYEEKYNQLK